MNRRMTQKTLGLSSFLILTSSWLPQTGWGADPFRIPYDQRPRACPELFQTDFYELQPRPRYKLRPMIEEYRRRDERLHVRRLSLAEKKQHQLFLGSDGRIRTADGKLFDTSRAQSMHTNHTGRAIVIMDETGDLYASTEGRKDVFQHSTLSNGAPVAFAGEIEVRNGTLVLLNDYSGHYQTNSEMTEQVLNRLSQFGIRPEKNGSGFKVEYYTPAPREFGNFGE